MFNTATLVGRVGSKESRVLKNGGEVTTLSIVTSKKWKDQSGTVQEQSTWHNIHCFSKLSEVAKKYVKVGDFLVVQGEIQNKKIESGPKEGQYMYAIHASDIKFIPKGNKTNEEQKQPTTQKNGTFDFEESEGVPF